MTERELYERRREEREAEERRREDRSERLNKLVWRIAIVLIFPLFVLIDLLIGFCKRSTAGRVVGVSILFMAAIMAVAYWNFGQWF